MFFVDTETSLIEQGLLAPPLTCLQFARNGGAVVVAVAGVDDIEELASQLLLDHVVGHNLAYDLLVLMTEYPSLEQAVFDAYNEDRIHCTIVREKLLRIARGTLKGARMSLADLARHYGGSKDSDDPWRLRYGELRGRPFAQWPKAAQDYATHDVEATRHVYNQQQDFPDEARQCRAAFLLHCVGAQGVHTDPEAVEKFENQINEEYLIDEATLKACGLVRAVGTKDTKAAKELMTKVCMAQDLEIRLTKKGQVSLDEDACTLSGDETLMAYQRYGSHKNLRTRLQGLKKGYDKPLNSRFDSLVETGRTSCSQGQYGYQIQNMRRKPGERECFVPADGNVFLACDYDSFELCTLAQVCLWTVGYSKLAQAINAGLDPHLAMAADMLGLSYDDAKAAYKDPGHPRHKEVAETRQGTKIANFGYPGGLGARTFVPYARGFGVTLDLEKAQDLKDAWFLMWPEMSEYFEFINNHPWYQITRGDHVWNVTNITQLRSQRVRGGVSFTQAANSFFQGLAADTAKAAGWRLLEWGEWPIWNFVHDEYILEGPEADGHRAAMAVQEIMEDVAREWLPDVRATASPTLMDRWSKNARQVWEGSRLVTWRSP